MEYLADMLDLRRLHRIRLSANPLGQRIVARAVLTPNYRIPPRVQIHLEGVDRLPEPPVIYAMNHTDRYNYWPFQYHLWRCYRRFTATWVKGKYYENRLLAKFMEKTNNIPTISRGYLVTRDFISVMGRRPADEEYKALRAWVDDAAAGGDDIAPPAGVPPEILERSRDVLGRRFDADQEDYPTYVNALHQTMMGRFLELNQEAFDLGLDVIVFPQGTRSVRLSRGHIGLAEVALAFQKTIVPVGCSGCDKVYPGGSPFAHGGEITYRLGEPIRYEEMAPFHIDEPFVPFHPEVERSHRDRFQGLVDLVMERINELVDPPYQFGDSHDSDGVRGASRFV